MIYVIFNNWNFVIVLASTTERELKDILIAGRNCVI